MLLRKHLGGGKLTDIIQDGLERIISFDFAIVGAAIGISVLLNLVFTAVPLLLLHNVKPIDIIKAKE
jgi:predicted ribosome quality control (RQC) complex YloA/Tae2 family protein